MKTYAVITLMEPESGYADSIMAEVVKSENVADETGSVIGQVSYLRDTQNGELVKYTTVLVDKVGD